MNNGSCVESVVNIQRNKSRSDDDDDEAEQKQQVESILVYRNYYTGG
jgi:hypothetical protein